MPKEAKYDNSLTPRELSVIELIAKGYTQAEIAGELFIGIPTVQHHTNSILSKLDARGNSRLAVYKAYMMGIIEPPSSLSFYGELLGRAREVVQELEAKTATLRKDNNKQEGHTETK